MVLAENHSKWWGIVRGIKKLSVAALVVASLAVIGSGAALWRTFDLHSGESAPAPATTVPAGPALVVVPTVIGKDGMSAAADLANLKLQVSVVTGPSVTTAKNKVMNQDPVPGTGVPEGSTVQLKLSTGPL